MKPATYVIDESGHSGDLASAKALDFANQPVFALACIGVTDPEGLADEIERLRIVHRCGPGELKSDMARLPQFVTDLAAYLDTVRRRNIWRKVGGAVTESEPRLGLAFKRRACGAASGDVRWFAS